MTTKNTPPASDVIELVRELKALHELSKKEIGSHIHVKADGSEVHEHPDKRGELAHKLLNAFPAIASALIEAVEALERVKKANDRLDGEKWADRGYLQSEMDKVVIIAENALERIHSLPSDV